MYVCNITVYFNINKVCGALNHTCLFLCFRFIRCLKIKLCEKVQHVRSTPIGTLSAVKTTEIRTLDMRSEPYRQYLHNSLTECVDMLPPSINLFYIFKLRWTFPSFSFLSPVKTSPECKRSSRRSKEWEEKYLACFDISVKADRGRGDYGIGERMEALMTSPYHSSHLRGHGSWGFR